MKNRVLKSMKAKLSILFIAVVVALTTIITVSDPSINIAVAASKPEISKKSRNILVGNKYNLNINNKVAKSTYKWTSSDDKIATVDNRGIVKAIKKGTVEITCSITAPDNSTFKVSSKITVRQPAMVFRIRNKISALNLGQEYDLNRRMSPAASNDKTTWTTSDATIANPDSLGKFTTLKEGEVTITGTTMSGKSDSVTFTVVDKEGIVTNQEDLDALVGSGAELVTIKTDEELVLNIKGGKHLDQTLVVDAPNADIVNRGVFKAVEIKQVKADTWYERAVGNILKILDKDVKIVIASYANVSIEVNEDKVVLRIVNNGKIEELVINKEADIDITGDSDEETPVTVNLPGIKIKTSVPLNLVSNAKFELEVLPGGEKTTIKTANKDFVPTIKGNVKLKVEIDGMEEDVQGIPTSNITPPSTGTQDSTTPPGLGEYRLDKDLNKVASVTVKFVPFSIEYKVDSEMLETLIGFLDDKAGSVDKWEATTETTKTYGKGSSSVEVKVTGESGSSTKKVEFLSGPIEGKSFDVTVDAANNSVKLKSGTNVYTVKKLTERSIQITPALNKDILEITFTYK